MAGEGSVERHSTGSAWSAGCRTVMVLPALTLIVRVRLKSSKLAALLVDVLPTCKNASNRQRQEERASDLGFPAAEDNERHNTICS